MATDAKQRFDAITLEILWRRLISIVDESDAAVARTAFSSLLRDAHDYTCMFTDARGRELAQGTLATPGQSLIAAAGGRGGRGNMRFATPTNRTSRPGS